ncbi:MFS general substrate transporter [Exophiala viscosa]|uniref:MFS general substrate transporter n=1 Tax=Exophiala viscosa TaxID=2486360 RepID=A0AAN6IBV5_9EURO|nr:MFS general substrate transporter [Exophiala viscosa]
MSKEDIHVNRVDDVEHGEQKTQDSLDILKDPVITAFPDGGFRAWLTVAGSFSVLFVASGFTYGYGIFISYYSTNMLKDHTISQISWIGSSAPFIHSVIGVPVGNAYDAGYFRHLMIGGSLLYVVAIMLLSICSKYYQVFLCQGVLVGVATGLIYQPSVTILSHYFSKRRALVMGIAASGASLGGVIYPILLNRLFVRMGFAWGVRTAGFMIAGILVLGNLAMTTRLPTRHRGTATVHAASDDVVNSVVPESIPSFNYRSLGEPTYLFTIVGCAMIMMGISLPFSYLQVFALTHQAISNDLAFYVLGIMMSGSVFGAIFWAYLADKLGVLNIVIFTTTISAALQFSLLGASHSGSVIAVGVLYGFFSSAFQAMLGPIFSRVSTTVTEIGHRMGFGFLVIGIGSLIGPPIQGALLGKNQMHFGWWKALLFAAVSLTDQ